MTKGQKTLVPHLRMDTPYDYPGVDHQVRESLNQVVKRIREEGLDIDAATREASEDGFSPVYAQEIAEYALNGPLPVKNGINRPEIKAIYFDIITAVQEQLDGWGDGYDPSFYGELLGGIEHSVTEAINRHLDIQPFPDQA